MNRPERHPTLEEGEEALLEGDEYFATRRRGTARAALAHREFRLMWSGSFASNIGTWMQNVVLGSYAYKLTGSSAFVGLLGFAQLGPLLLLSILGGVVADVLDRRRILLVMQFEQLVASLILAWLVSGSEPSRVALLACVLAIGIGNAFNAPAWSAVLPSLVGRDDLPGAISLNSFMINGSRVVGPAIAGVLYPVVGAAWIFFANAFTYGFVIVALLLVRFPPTIPSAERGWARVAGGFRAARDNPVVGRILVTLAIFSLLCLPFVSLFAPLAERDLDLDSKSLTYGLLYATFGLGACLGALAIGTVLAQVPKMPLVRIGLAGFSVALFAFGAVRHVGLALPIVFVLGAMYFGTTTSMLTVMQSILDDAVRGRVMALWFMAFGGTVTLGGLAFGPLLDATNGTVVLTIGAVVAAFLAWWCNLAWVAKLAMLQPV